MLCNNPVKEVERFTLIDRFDDPVTKPDIEKKRQSQADDDEQGSHDDEPVSLVSAGIGRDVNTSHLNTMRRRRGEGF